MRKDVLSELNKEQRKAVEQVNGPSIILAGAGSGKTRVLTAKVTNMINQGVTNPENIMMVTFTNKAAKEMKERVGSHLGFVGTFHRFCARALRIYGEHIGIGRNFVIWDGKDQESIMKDLLKQTQMPEKMNPRFVLSRISGAKDRLITAKQYSAVFTDERSKTIGSLYRRYQKLLDDSNALDFDDLLFKTVFLLDKVKEVRDKLIDRYRYILVDEFHDTNYVQYVIIKKLGKKHKNVTVVGDFSQSIYSWRGAEIENLKKFEDDFAPVAKFHLQRNYRSTNNILNFAYDVISHNESHPILKLFTDNGPGEDVVVRELASEREEGVFLASTIDELSKSNDLKSIAILYRMNAQSRAIEEVFLHTGIPYVLIGGTSFYQRKEIKDILSYLRIYVNSKDAVSIKRALKLGKRRYASFEKLTSKLEEKEEKPETIDAIDLILKATDYLDKFDKDDPDDYSRLENIKELRSVASQFPNPQEFLEQVALVESEYSVSEKKDKDGVQMMTLHQAKGLEFPHVFIVGAEEGILPHSRSQFDRHAVEEERRLFYVGATRAMKRLYVTHAKRRFFFGTRAPARVSRFLEEAGAYVQQDY